MERFLSKWSPTEIRKTIILILGIVLIFKGANLCSNQTIAKNVIDFKVGTISASIESASVGIILIVLGFVLMLLNIISIKISKEF